MSGRRRGFTLLELLAVVALLGIILFFVVPNVDAMTPGARLKSTARKIASTMELAQGEAIASQKEFTVAYDLSRQTYWIILPPKEDEPQQKLPDPNEVQPPPPDVEHGKFPEVQQGSSGNQGAPKPTAPPKTAVSYANRETLGEDELPPDIEIQSVTLQSGKESTSGVIYVPFSSLGNEGSHAVMVRLKSKNFQPTKEPPICVRFNALTRTVDFANEKLGWEQLNGP